MMLTSCFGEPEFPLEPEIEFAWIENYNPTELNDSVYIALTFRDGDGDLGLSEDDINGPYAPYEQDKLPEDTVANKYHNNYFVSILRKEDDGIYRSVVFEAEQDFNGRFPRLNDSGRERPLEGELRYGIVLYYDGVLQSPLNKGDSIKFTINIADRALNESNEITTAGIEIGTPKEKEEGQEETATPTD
ncbi:hypothetical protein EI427_20230 [Flammeovirga pectinis]|uniref:Uncharacterized protein n=1 Tax=Flammeovirga pectinis TaxID=2494373 RepID=A0A3Q9FU24_9BACT|nr:hypothetical protein [Flammeovirga pectinis]AZQ64452.1 hypothetical protein EI427_20230 [Flammeovirga pectinis]